MNLKTIIHCSHRRWFSVVFLVLAVNLTAASARGKVYSLTELRDMASRENLRIRIADIEPRMRREELADTGRLENPGIELAWGRFTPEGMPTGEGIQEVAVHWKIPNPFYRSPLLRAGRSRVTAAEIQADMVRREVLRGVTIHYHLLRYYQRERELLEKKHLILQEIARISRARVQIGEAREIDALRAGVEAQKCLSALHRSRKQGAAEAGRLNEFLGNTLPVDFSVDRKPVFMPLDLSEADVMKRLEETPLIRLSRVRQEEAVSLRRAETLSVIDSITLFSVGEKEAEGRKWKVGMGVEIPLFNGGGHRRRMARLRERKSRIELKHARQHFHADLRRLLAEISSLEKEIATFSGPLMRESEANLFLSRRLYREGEIQLVVFLDAQNSHFELQERFARAISEWGCRVADLRALLGGEK